MSASGYSSLTRKMVPITGRASSFLYFWSFQNQNSEVGWGGGGGTEQQDLSIY